MNLGERIYLLRTQKGLSQGDLAEALEVSRQSISKWETGSSVPELDKLIKLSQLFGITLDELVLDKEPASAPPPEPKIIYVEKQAPRSTAKTAGVVLLCFSALVWLMITLLGDILAGLVLASPFLACGLICLFVRQNVGLWCLWAVYAFADLYMRFTTGVSWQFAFWRIGYSGIGNPGHLIIAWSNFAIFAALTVSTVLRLRKNGPVSVKPNAIGSAIAWIVYFLLPFVVANPSRGSAVTDPDQIRLYATANAVGGWLRTVVVVVALTFTVRLLTVLWKRRKASNTET